MVDPPSDDPPRQSSGWPTSGSLPTGAEGAHRLRRWQRLRTPLFWLLGLAAASLFAISGPGSKLLRRVFYGPPSFSFGVIPDCQYADLEGKKRRYRLSKTKLSACVEDLNSQRLSFVVQLGDLIETDLVSYEVVLPILSGLQAETFSVLGNHDFYVEDNAKVTVPQRLGLKERYYSLRRHGWSFLFLDGNDLSLKAWPRGSPQLARSKQRYAETPKETTRRWNGDLGPAQRAWLEERLQEATQQGERVLIFCHFPLLPVGIHELWSAEELRALLKRYPCVQAWFSGHNHDGAYVYQGGVHYLTFKAMVDTTKTAYATVEVYPERLVVAGVGREPRRTLSLRSAPGR